MFFNLHFSRTDTPSRTELWLKIETSQVNTLVLDWLRLEETDFLHGVATNIELESGESIAGTINLCFRHFCQAGIPELIFRSLLADQWELESE